MMRNPNAMREAMRSQDLQMSQLENIPGGFNAMRRMFEEVQEPMMEASQNMANAAAGANSGNTASSTSAAGTGSAAPTNTALPNPWGGGGGGAAASSNAAANPFAAMGAGGFNPYSGMGGGAANPFAGMGGMGGMGGVGGMGDPNQAMAMMQDPMMRQMMQQMLADPRALDQVRLSCCCLLCVLELLQCAAAQRMMSSVRRSAYLQFVGELSGFLGYVYFRQCLLGTDPVCLCVMFPCTDGGDEPPAGRGAAEPTGARHDDQPGLHPPDDRPRHHAGELRAVPRNIHPRLCAAALYWKCVLHRAITPCALCDLVSDARCLVFP
jgi:hypothetical protein